TLRLRVEGMPAERIKDLLWAVDDGKWQPFVERAGTGGTTDCAQPLEWARGVHKVRVVLRTNEEVAQEFASDLSWRYAPPPPVVEPRGATKKATGQPLETDQDRFSLEAAIRPGLEGEKLTVVVYQQNRAPVKLTPVDGTVRHDVPLLPGTNPITVV